MKINNPTPFNGEPPPSLLLRSFITPNELHFIRNRLPVPQVDVCRFLIFPKLISIFVHFLARRQILPNADEKVHCIGETLTVI